MASIRRKLEKKGVITMTLLTLVLIGIACEDRIDNPAVDPLGGKMVEVSLNIGFANEVDGTIRSTDTKAPNDSDGNKQSAFDMQVVPASQTRAVATTAHPDKLYNLEIHQYGSGGAHLASFEIGSSIAPGTAITQTLNDNNGAECSLLIIARGNTGAVASLSGNSLSKVNAVTADKTKLETVNASTGDNINNMPYLLYLPKVKIVNGKLVSPEGTDVRLLLKRLAVGVSINWTFSDDMQKSYTLSEVRLMQVPKDYRILPKTEYNTTFGTMYPTSESEFVDGFRLKGEELTDAKGSQTFWMPANARGTRNDVNYPTYRNKNYAHSAATYVEFVVNSTEKKERLLYRAYLGGNTTNDFNLLENTNYHWTINITAANYTTDPRIQLQDLSPIISTNLQTTSNCFMMQPGTNICFNPYKHDAEKDGYNNDITDGWNPYLINANTISEEKQITYVKVFWQSKDNATSGDLVVGYSIDSQNHSNLVNLTEGNSKENARIHVKVPNTKGGNAVIAAYNKSDVIVWSWHLWITNYVPQGITSSITYEEAQKQTREGTVHQYPNAAFKAGGNYYNKVSMDRNLGADAGSFPDKKASQIEVFKRLGYLYYWGRKDPFFGLVDGTTNEIDVIYDGDGYSTSVSKIPYNNSFMVNGNMMQYTIQNPLTVLVGKDVYSWYNNDETSSAYQYLYADSKTLYDPCPAGWKIPNNSIYNGLNTSNAYWYGTNGTFVQSNSSDKNPNGGRLYNLTGNSGVPEEITIHNTAWFPVTGFRSEITGDLALNEGRGYEGTSTIGKAGSSYRLYYIRYNGETITLLNGGGVLNQPMTFRCVQK